MITFQVGLPTSRYAEPADACASSKASSSKLAALPGVSSGGVRRVRADDARCARPAALRSPASHCRLRAPNQSRSIFQRVLTTPAVMGLRMIDGRWITERDRPDAPPVVVISESFARQYFPRRARRRPSSSLLQRTPDRAAARRRRRSSASCPTSASLGWRKAEAPQMYVPHAQRAVDFHQFLSYAPPAIRARCSPALPPAVHCARSRASTRTSAHARCIGRAIPLPIASRA